MQTFSRLMSAALVAGFMSVGAHAQERGTKEEAVAMVEAAVAHVKKVGADKAYADFTADKAAWTKKDLYVFAFDMEGKTLAHGGNGALVGKSLANLKDASGKATVIEMGQLAKTKGSGWVDYQWAHPETKKVEMKSSYVTKTPGADSYVGVGIYLSQNR